MREDQLVRWRDNLGPGEAINLAVSRDGGNWVPLIDGTRNRGREWIRTPSPPSDRAQLRLSWVRDGRVNGLSEAFVIMDSPCAD